MVCDTPYPSELESWDPARHGAASGVARRLRPRVDVVLDESPPVAEARHRLLYLPRHMVRHHGHPRSGHSCRSIWGGLSEVDPQTGANVVGVPSWPGAQPSLNHPALDAARSRDRRGGRRGHRIRIVDQHVESIAPRAKRCCEIANRVLSSDIERHRQDIFVACVSRDLVAHATRFLSGLRDFA